jgi:hypothetical protein
MLLQKGSTKPVGVEGFDRRAVLCERLNLSHTQNRDLVSPQVPLYAGKGFTGCDLTRP